jgi:rubrerythrin
MEKATHIKKVNVKFPDVEVYRKTENKLRKSIDFYRSKAEHVRDDTERAAFLKIARARERRFYTLEEMIEFLTRPSHWLENPEWYHLEDY